MIKKWEKAKNHWILDFVCEGMGTLFLSIGIYCFLEKVNIAPGGISGVAIMLKYLFGFPIGIMSLILNVPLVWLAYRYMGKVFTLRTVRTLILSTIFLDFIVTPFFPQYAGDRMLGAIFGGLFCGIGLALVFWRGSSTGGTDILSFLLERKFPHIPLGTTLMLIDLVILSASCFVFRNIESGLFGIVALFCQTKVIDGVIYGMDRGKSVMIISEKNEAIAKRILEEMERGATFLCSKGAYSKKDGTVLFCVVRRVEFHELKTIVHAEDSEAFLIVCEAEQILGEGFRPIQKS